MIQFKHREIHVALAALSVVLACGCSPAYEQYRRRGTQLLAEQRYAAARGLFEAAHEMVPENADNLCDLAACHVGMARDYLARDDTRAAVRELDAAINYYNRAIRSYPGYSRALAGKNTALELRGDPGEALATAQWASQVVGPSARQQIFLARELAERGDADQALLAFKQAVAMEPDNPSAHWAIGLFYIDLGRREEGIHHLERAYRIDPSQDFIAAELRQLGAEVPIMDEEIDEALEDSTAEIGDEKAHHAAIGMNSQTRAGHAEPVAVRGNGPPQ